MMQIGVAVVGAVITGASFFGSALATRVMQKYEQVANELKKKPIMTVDQAIQAVKAAQKPLYLCVEGKTTGDGSFIAKVSQREALFTSTTVKKKLFFFFSHVSVCVCVCVCV